MDGGDFLIVLLKLVSHEIGGTNKIDMLKLAFLVEAC